MEDPKIQIIVAVPNGVPIPIFRVACSVPAHLIFVKDGQVVAETEANSITEMAAIGMKDR